MPVDPALLVAAAGLTALHHRGVTRHEAIARAASWRFTGALVVLIAATAPWFERFADGSFAWHMLQHQLLTLVVAPLVASSRPVAALRAAVGREGSGSGGRPLPWRDATGVTVLVAAALSLATLLLWHLPPFYDAALASPILHRLEHLLLLGTATLAWGAVFVAARDDRAAAAVVALAASAIIGAALGVVLLTAPTPLYAYAGPSALTEQQLGGALMKVGALFVHAGAAVWLASRWLARLEAAT